ncbi:MULTISPECIES: hypothetical protein [unclassified Rhodococcus (in: high G+C Gram-positive bacteria)]|nr:MULTISPECIES: hypothetical protein [unclassified Rhodococcus (in: high G+C Gram-positive bacteria)]MBC2640493.1 hypothetical protein [Rhodococcus sp. 3A]MBC2894761.1 hypothetical protein [Rhodococcus sp. 4CII]
MTDAARPEHPTDARRVMHLEAVGHAACVGWRRDDPSAILPGCCVWRSP